MREKRTLKKALALILLSLFFQVPGIAQGRTGQITAELNGLQITLDSDTGSIIRLTYPGPGIMLDTPVKHASIVDAAYPVEEFLPLRLASRFSKNAEVEVTKQQVTVHWSKLGPSRTHLGLDPEVSATVRLKEHPDGMSTLMTCEIENYSDKPVCQVLFPDFMGFIPFAGEDEMEFRTAGSIYKPFEILKFNDHGQFYPNRTIKSYVPNRGSMILRWMDLGSLKGGVSLFPQRWKTDEKATVLIHLSETTDTLRLMCSHDLEIKPSEKWQSPVYVLTPHKSGWAKGIEPAREYMQKQVSRTYPVPQHIRSSLGYRTLFMSQNLPKDPADAAWHITDLPRAAKESKQHGLDEIVFWCMFPTEVPLPSDPYPHLGTRAQLAEAIEKCEEMDVNVSAFITCLLVEYGRDSDKYKLRNPNRRPENWTYHPEMMPQFRASYSSAKTWVRVDPADPNWQQDVLVSLEDKAKIGLASFCWDVYQQDMGPINSKIRAMAKSYDPDSTYAGEQQQNLEYDCEQLDYTWNWNVRYYRDYRALVNLLPLPRYNLIIGAHSIEEALKGFSDNLFLNVMPRKPGDINGSARIGEYPQLSMTLKKCAKLRKQFLSYFTEGTLIGDCVLIEPAQDAHVNAYVLADSMLIIALNTANETRSVNLNCDFSSWIENRFGHYSAKIYDDNGKLQTIKYFDTPNWFTQTEALRNLEMDLIEITCQETQMARSNTN